MSRSRRDGSEQYIASAAVSAAVRALARDAKTRVVPERTRVLDYGCGRGYGAQALAARTRRLIGVDASPARVETFNEVVLRQGIPWDEMHAVTVEQFDSPNGGYAREQFDVALVRPSARACEYSLQCLQTLHHVEAPARTIDALVRRVKPGGAVVVVDLAADLDDADSPLSAESDTSSVASIADGAMDPVGGALSRDSDADSDATDDASLPISAFCTVGGPNAHGFTPDALRDIMKSSSEVERVAVRVRAIHMNARLHQRAFQLTRRQLELLKWGRADNTALGRKRGRAVARWIVATAIRRQRAP